MEETIIQANHLSKKYKDIYAVNDASFVIKKGEIVGLVGKNGAGKTTLIRMLTGIASVSEGSFSLFGDDSKTKYKQLAKVATMIEAPALYERMDAVSNMVYACKIKGVKDPIKSGYIKEKLEFVGLGDMYSSKRKVADYSLGMKQRLSIAMATIGEPELMILDEPTNGLDPSGIKEIRDLLTKLNKEKGVTMIISSHILSELSKFATSYIFIDSGKIMEQVSAIDMEKKVGKIIQIVTDNVEKTTSLFNEKDVSFTFDGKTFCIKDVDDVLAILNMLQAAGIKPLSFKEEENALEDYYLELLGGNENA